MRQYPKVCRGAFVIPGYDQTLRLVVVQVPSLAVRLGGEETDVVSSTILAHNAAAMDPQDDQVIPVCGEISIEVHGHSFTREVVDRVPGPFQRIGGRLNEGRVGLGQAQLIDDDCSSRY